MSKQKQITYTENDRLIANVLSDHPEGLTLNEMKELTGVNLVSGHIVGAMSKGIVVASGERDVLVPSKRKVCSYTFVTDEALTKPDGKSYNYSEGEQAILAAAKDFEAPFTLAQLSEVMGRKITSGSTNALIKKGNLAKGDQVEVEGIATNTVKVYSLAEGWLGFNEA